MQTNASLDATDNRCDWVVVYSHNVRVLQMNHMAVKMEKNWFS